METFATQIEMFPNTNEKKKTQKIYHASVIKSINMI